MIELPAGAVEGDLWRSLCELANGFAGEWTLIGARMIDLYALEHDVAAPRFSQDADALVGAKSVGSRPQDLAAWLEAHGWHHDGYGPDGVGHRYRRAAASIDVLAPDHLGQRADLTTTSPARTVAVPGGRQALNRTESVAVRCRDDEAELPRPALPGALVIKAQAVTIDDAPDAQRRDLAFLCSLVDDVDAVRAQLAGGDRQHLAARQELANPNHTAWRALRDRGGDAHAAFMRLSTP
jgi:hypothetical protein